MPKPILPLEHPGLHVARFFAVLGGIASGVYYMVAPQEHIMPSLRLRLSRYSAEAYWHVYRERLDGPPSVGIDQSQMSIAAEFRKNGLDVLADIIEDAAKKDAEKRAHNAAKSHKFDLNRTYFENNHH
ncbi:hypothetical protein ROZALSC1DRAFT_28163 [Rozella allomycis CSF55]|uniref:Uncharacterized protein n=1 Tax=Rozella allomycis (strain CSF55) TaxID=988480 RepID=A0A075ANR2_ROZAC|nr:hypothetical protein O9G_000005 [Rozella allomycis CSF55]RKP20333.1 hypothetical protein ROZALSC1DRAFT_28163 [Rozella allomycis CSF55]|eukprot:EPZ31529.1 hypothetical protein O9G_000005 [Rozella allomycis CSF55]